jgi:hypothetical protein
MAKSAVKFQYIFRERQMVVQCRQSGNGLHGAAIAQVVIPHTEENKCDWAAAARFAEECNRRMRRPTMGTSLTQGEN